MTKTHLKRVNKCGLPASSEVCLSWSLNSTLSWHPKTPNQPLKSAFILQFIRGSSDSVHSSLYFRNDMQKRFCFPHHVNSTRGERVSSESNRRGTDVAAAVRDNICSTQTFTCVNVGKAAVTLLSVMSELNIWGRLSDLLFLLQKKKRLWTAFFSCRKLWCSPLIKVTSVDWTWMQHNKKMLPSCIVGSVGALSPEFG